MLRGKTVWGHREKMTLSRQRAGAAAGPWSAEDCRQTAGTFSLAPQKEPPADTSSLQNGDNPFLLLPPSWIAPAALAGGTSDLAGHGP